jgi:hypothetical protein
MAFIHCQAMRSAQYGLPADSGFATREEYSFCQIMHNGGGSDSCSTAAALEQYC